MRAGVLLATAMPALWCCAVFAASAAPVVSDLNYPELTDQDSIEVSGRVNGTLFLQQHPLKGPPGDYELTVLAYDLEGHETSSTIKVRKARALPLGYAASKMKEDLRPSKEKEGLRPLKLEGDYALVISIGDNGGNRSSQLLRSSKTVSQPAELGKIRIKEVWVVIRKTVSDAVYRVGEKIARTVRTAFQAVQWKPSVPAVRAALPSGTGLVSLEGRSPSGVSDALVSVGPWASARPKPKRAGGVVRTAGVTETTVTASAAQGEKMVELESRILSVSSETSAVTGAGPAKVEANKIGYTDTHVRIPDEYGGMTITTDNFKTGERTIIRKDKAGQEVERRVIPMPGLKKKTLSAKPAEEAAP